MAQCKRERKLKLQRTLRSIAKEVDATENYLNAVENGREMPSLIVFLKYLTVSGFDLSPLTRMAILRPPAKVIAANRRKYQLSQKVYSLEEDQVSFLLAQAKMAEELDLQSRPKRKRRARRSRARRSR